MRDWMVDWVSDFLAALFAVVDWLNTWLSGWLSCWLSNLFFYLDLLLTKQRQDPVKSDFFHVIASQQCAATRERMLKINPQFWHVKQRIW